MRQLLLLTLSHLFHQAAVAQCTADAGPNQTITCIDTVVFLSGSSDVPNATFQWSGPNGFTSTEPSPAVFLPGTYTLTITTPSGCTATDEVIVVIDTVAPIISATGGVLPCGGSITLSGQSNTPGVTFVWTGPGGFISNVPNPVVDTPGDYTFCAIASSNGCFACATVVVAQGPQIIIAPWIQEVRCFGGSDGAIALVASGGTPPYTYAWSDGDTAAVRLNLAAGTYQVTITDASGCTSTQTYVVGQPPALQPIGISVRPISCLGNRDGAIEVDTIIGGTGPYEFTWSGPDGFITNQSLSLDTLKAGTYTLQITDSRGCTALYEYVVAEPSAPLEISRIVVCEEAAVLGVRGGWTPYFATWTYADTVVMYYGLSIGHPLPGVYTVAVMDSFGCTQRVIVEIPEDAPPCTRIVGRVQHDKNQDCQFDAADSNLSGWVVQAEGASGFFYGITDADGEYTIFVDKGAYSARVFTKSAQDVVCQNDVPVQLQQVGEVATVDFLVQVVNPTCPRLTVDLSAAQLRRCFPNNFYVLRYCNTGTADAADVVVTLELDPWLSVVSAQRTFTQSGNTLTFELGTLPAGHCGQFWVNVAVSCEAALGQTHCSKAAIFPNQPCDTLHPSWSGAHVEVRSQCEGDSLYFLLRNVGSGPMSRPLEYIVIEDGIMLRQGSGAPLKAGETMTVSVPANGATWRIEAEQEPYSPRSDRPILSVEGCTTSGSFSTGFVSQFPTGEGTPVEDVHCSVNSGAYDPNDKQAFPIGYGEEHYVLPGTELEYLIRFQNTGTDTAFTVIVRDTLSPWLDPTTVRPGASSHPYRFNLYGPGILLFDFQNIMLPDSHTNEMASHGFVKFSVKPRSNTPLGTHIFNRAAIYFDFNDPVITNATHHLIAEDFLIQIGTWAPTASTYTLRVYPHPVQQTAVLTVEGTAEEGLFDLHLWDPQGRLVLNMRTHRPRFEFNAEQLPGGTYFFCVQRDGLPIGNGKIVVLR